MPALPCSSSVRLAPRVEAPCMPASGTCVTRRRDCGMGGGASPAARATLLLLAAWIGLIGASAAEGSDGGLASAGVASPSPVPAATPGPTVQREVTVVCNGGYKGFETGLIVAVSWLGQVWPLCVVCCSAVGTAASTPHTVGLWSRGFPCPHAPVLASAIFFPTVATRAGVVCLGNGAGRSAAVACRPWI